MVVHFKNDVQLLLFAKFFAGLCLISERIDTLKLGVGLDCECPYKFDVKNVFTSDTNL
jgi:hypothetical protein